MKRLTRDEARRIATNIAKLPELLQGSLGPASINPQVTFDAIIDRI